MIKLPKITEGPEFIEAVRFVASWPERGFVIDVKDFGPKMDLDPWMNLGSFLYDDDVKEIKFSNFWNSLYGSAKVNWIEYLPIWQQQFFRDVLLLYEFLINKKNGTTHPSVYKTL